MRNFLAMASQRGAGARLYFVAAAVEAWAAHGTVCGPDVDLPWHREAGLDRLCVALAVVILVGAGASRVLKALSAYA